MIAVGRSDPGREREGNEDKFFISTKSRLKLFAVADGMGGHPGGEVASAIAIEVLRDFTEGKIPVANNNWLSLPPAEEIINIVRELIFISNKRIRELADASLEGMGTTLTMAVISGELITIGHIGDSRAYLITSDRIRQLTEDHSLVVELIKSGQIDEKEALSHPQRHVLTRALGIEPEPEADIFQLRFEPSAYLLLCTDGLTSLVGTEELYQIIVEKGNNPRSTIDYLIELSNQRGGYDNITAVLIKGTGTRGE